MADPNESQRDHRTQQDAGVQPAASAEPAEIVEAEIVEEPPQAGTESRAAPGQPASPGSASSRSSSTTGPADDEEFRQYQQFLEFQRFQEWQRQQGADDSAGAAPGPRFGAPGEPAAPAQRRPWWRRALRLLRYRFVRRLIYLLVFLLVLYYLISSVLTSFTGGGGAGQGSAPGTGGGPAGAAPVAPPSPQRVVRGLYHYVALQPEQTCALFTDSGKAAFAYAYGTGDCTAAAQRAHTEVTDPGGYANPRVDLSAIVTVQSAGQAQVDSCDLGVSGGKPLGEFRMSRQANGGWQIDQYQPSRCG